MITPGDETDNWQKVEDAFNEFKKQLCAFREGYFGDRHSDAWLMGWCIAWLDWTGTTDQLKQELLLCLDESKIFKGVFYDKKGGKVNGGR